MEGNAGLPPLVLAGGFAPGGGDARGAPEFCASSRSGVGELSESPARALGELHGVGGETGPGGPEPKKASSFHFRMHKNLKNLIAQKRPETSGGGRGTEFSKNTNVTT